MLQKKKVADKDARPWPRPSTTNFNYYFTRTFSAGWIYILQTEYRHYYLSIPLYDGIDIDSL